MADDVIVFGRTEQEHDAALHRLMRAAANHGLVFRLEKSAIRQLSINFFGLVWSQKGMQPYPKKCKNIRNKKSPGNAQELLSFLGLIQYLSPFISHLATNTKLLRQLLKKDTPWEWNAEHEQAFVDLKDMILYYFDHYFGHFSKMPFVKLLRSTVSEEVVKYRKELFSLHGIPKKFYTDNGPRYACRQWREFAKD
jgi:hypothetical protein